MNKNAKEYLELCRSIEVKESYCRNCTKCNSCYQEGNYGSYSNENADCKQGLYYADKKQLKKNLREAYNYIPANFTI